MSQLCGETIEGVCKERHISKMFRTARGPPEITSPTREVCAPQAPIKHFISTLRKLGFGVRGFPQVTRGGSQEPWIPVQALLSLGLMITFSPSWASLRAMAGLSARDTSSPTSWGSGPIRPIAELPGIRPHSRRPALSLPPHPPFRARETLRFLGH